MRTIETTVYTFDELDLAAKNKARGWYRDGQDDWFAESVIEDAATIAAMMGIELKTRPVELMSGKMRRDPCIYWSGFWSQGDGACFEGRYQWAKGCVKAIKTHAPLDTELHRIVGGLAKIQKQNQYAVVMDITQHGHYSHAYSMGFDDVSNITPVQDLFTSGDSTGLTSADDFESVCELLRDFADWIYRQLEAEYDYQNSNEQVDESIMANEYEFDEEGNRA